MKTFSANPGYETLVPVICNLCHTNSTRPYLDCGTFAYVQCRACGLIYQNPQPVFTDLQERYRDDYFAYEINNETNFFNLMKLGLADIHFDTITQHFPEHKNFLDIGCATGMLLEHLRAKGWQTQGVDICKESAAYGIKKRGLNIFAGALEAAHFADGFFHAIHFSHLIEHITDPMALLKEVRRILAPGGYIVVTTPNAQGFQARLLGKRWRSAIADHLFLFTKKTLQQALEKTGFTIKQSLTWGGIAKGLAPLAIKQPIDSLAKRCGFGDVMLYLATK